MRVIAIAVASSVIACGDTTIEPVPLLEATGSFEGTWLFEVIDPDKWCEDYGRERHLCHYGSFAFPGQLEIVRESSSTLAGQFTIDTTTGWVIRDSWDLVAWGPDTTRHELGLQFADAGLISGCVNHGIEDDSTASEIMMPLDFTLGDGTHQAVEDLIGCSLLQDLQRWQALVLLRIVFGVPHEELGRIVTLVVSSPDDHGTPQQFYQYMCGDRRLLIYSSFAHHFQHPIQPP